MTVTYKEHDLVKFDALDGGELLENIVGEYQDVKNYTHVTNIRPVEAISSLEIARYLDAVLEDQNYHSMCGIYEGLYNLIKAFTGNEYHIMWVYLSTVEIETLKNTVPGDIEQFLEEWEVVMTEDKTVDLGKVTLQGEPVYVDPKDYQFAMVPKPIQGNKVDHPKHYNSHPSGVECIEIIRHMNFNLGNVIKYLWRNGLKGEEPALDDLKKARWYLDDEIKRVERESQQDE